MELWDIYNQNREKTGRQMTRGQAMLPGEYHLVVHACIFNPKGEMLIQQRQPFKEGWPNLWDITVGGSALAGEDSSTAMERELREEIGLAVDLQGVRPNLTINFSCGFDDVYLIQQDIDMETLTLQYEEVQQVKWAAIEEIFQMLDQKTFIPYHKSLIQLFFDTRWQYGCHIQK